MLVTALRGLPISGSPLILLNIYLLIGTILGLLASKFFPAESKPWLVYTFIILLWPVLITVAIIQYISGRRPPRGPPPPGTT